MYRGNLIKVLLVHGLIISIYALLVATFYMLEWQPENIIYALSLLLVCQLVWSLWSWTLTGNRIFSLYGMFTIAAFTFNGGLALLEIFQVADKGVLHGEVTAQVASESLAMVLLALVCMHTGALLALLEKHPFSRWMLRVDKPDLRKVGWFLLFISAYPALAQLRSAFEIVLAHGYMGLYQQAPNVGFEASGRVLSLFLMPAVLCLLIGNEKRKWLTAVMLAIILADTFSNFFLGARSAAIMPLIAFFWAWDRAVRPLPKAMLLIAGALLLFVVFPLIAAIRDVGGADRLSWDFIVNSYTAMNNPVFAIIYEMGESLKTVAYTLELVPRLHDFDLGTSYYYALLAIIPNLFWDIHPSVAHGPIANWLIWQVDPIQAAAGGGLGYSFIAEAYFNFGWFGIPVIISLIGFLIGRVSRRNSAGGLPVTIFIEANVMSFLLFFARSESNSLLRFIIWYVFIPCGFMLVCSVFRKNGHSLHAVAQGR